MMVATQVVLPQHIVVDGHKGVIHECDFAARIIFLSNSILSVSIIKKDTNTIIIIKKDKKIIPKDFMFDFKFKISFVEIINPAKIQN